MDRLEKFISENRDDFDRGIPDLKVWAELDKQLSAAEVKPKQEAKFFSLRRVMRIAAAGAILLMAGGIGGGYLANKYASSDVSSLADIAPEHAEAEVYFNQQIQEKTAKLASYEQVNTVQPDLQQLDEVFEELKSELKEAPKGSEEEIVNAMIQNYQAKIDILNRVLEKVEDVETPAKTTQNEISI